MTPEQFFYKNTWDSFFGSTKYFNQKPWDVATTSSLLKRVKPIWEFYDQELNQGNINFNSYCTSIICATEMAFHECFYD